MIDIIARIDGAYHVCHRAVNGQPSGRVCRDEQPVATGDYVILGQVCLDDPRLIEFRLMSNYLMGLDGSSLNF